MASRKKTVIKQAHLKDIDFRTREQRQKGAIQDFTTWYVELSGMPYSDIIQGQLSMLSAVLWHLLPAQEYKKLVTSKHDLGLTPDDYQEELATELSWIT